MRDIKFKAWHIKQKRWCQLQMIEHDCALVLITDEYGDPEWVIREDVEIVQFTGLLDHNRREIYEGDILTSSIQPREGDEPTTSVVKWSNTPYTAHFDFGVAPACHLAVVIGNVHDSQDLL